MSSTSNPQFSVALVGGGVAGMSLAIKLLSHGMAVTIYEAAHHFGTIGAGLAFGPNSFEAMNRIDPTIKSFLEHVSDAESTKSDLMLQFIRATDNEPIYALRTSKPHGFGARATFLDQLVHLVAPENVQFAKRLSALTKDPNGGYNLSFMDGTTAKHDIVIGCDGIHSHVRDYVLGADHPDGKPSWTRKVNFRGLVAMKSAIKILGFERAMGHNLYAGEGKHLVTFPVNDMQDLHVGAFATVDSWDHEAWIQPASKEEMAAEFSDWPEDIVQLMSLIERSDKWALFDLPQVPVYWKDEVALVGDAAHATTPFQGSGASMAVEDAFILGELLGRVKDQSQVQAALKAYDTVRRPCTQELVRTSRTSCQVCEFRDPEVGHDLEKMRKDLHTRYDWIWDIDLDAELADGIKQMDELLAKQ